MGGDPQKMREVLDGNLERFRSPIPLRKLATVEDVAAAVAFLASDAAGHITGQVLAIDGGQGSRLIVSMRIRQTHVELEWHCHQGGPMSESKSKINPLIATAACALLICVLPARGAADEGFPNKPLRVVVGFSPGSVVDISARVIAQKLAESWGQQVVVDNRPGAGGIIAAQTVAAANPDGYTLLSVSASHAVAPAIYAKLPYDTLEDFAGITTTVNSPAVLAVSPALGVKSVMELIALAKAKPGQLNFSSGGTGSATHFSAELFKSMAGIDVVHVPYKGIPEALSETMSGRVQYFLSPLAVALPMMKEGKVLALAVSSAKRVAVIPEVPTIAEAGVPGYRWDTWFGLLAPAKTPGPIIAKLNREITRILDLPDVRQRWTALGTEPIPSTAAEFDQLIARDIASLTKLARAANIKAN